MFRLKIVIIVVGAFLAFDGFKEWKVSRGTSTKPDAVELSELEKSPDISNNHLKVGDHIAIYSDCVYQYEVKDGETGEPTSEAKVYHTYYPIISHDHPHIREIDDMVEKYGDVDKIPDAEWPELEKFTVLVKTGKFKTLGDIPDEWKNFESLQGLVINRIHSLSGEEKDLVQSSFPTLDLEKLLIIEEGRVPSSGLKSGILMGGGAILILVGLGLFFVPSKKTNPSA